MKCYVWSSVLCGVETWLQVRIEAFELRILRWLLRIPLTAYLANKEVLSRGAETTARYGRTAWNILLGTYVERCEISDAVTIFRQTEDGVLSSYSHRREMNIWPTKCSLAAQLAPEEDPLIFFLYIKTLYLSTLQDLIGANLKFVFVTNLHQQFYQNY